MKQSIKRSLLSLMLLGAATNIQASVEEEQGGGGTAAVADQEILPVEQMQKFVLRKVKTAIVELLINWPKTVDAAVEMVGDTDGSIRTAMNMMFESFPEDVELTANVLEILVDAPLNELMHPNNFLASSSNIETTLYKLNAHIGEILWESLKQPFTKQTITFTVDDFFQKIITKMCKQKQTHNSTNLNNTVAKLLASSTSSTYTIIPTDKKLAAIIKQSKTQHKITFLRGDQHSTVSDHQGDFIIIPENYVPTAILHEIGHIENGTSPKLKDLKVKLLKIIEQIIGSKLSTNNKLKQLLITDLIMLSFRKKEEHDADTFMLQTATKEQLPGQINCLLASRSLDDFFSDEEKKRVPLPVLDALNIKNVFSYRQFFYAPHPSTPSRIKRIQERITELEAKAIATAKRKFDFAQKSTLEQLLAKITHCRYLRFLAGAKKAPREQLRARL